MGWVPLRVVLQKINQDRNMITVLLHRILSNVSNYEPTPTIKKGKGVSLR